MLILTAPLVCQAQTPAIEGATVNLAKGAMTLSGSNFSPAGVAPTVTVGGASSTVSSFTNTTIVVEVPSTLAAGTYLVSVTNSIRPSVSAYVTVGAVGPQGPAGATGATGAAGPAGPQGPASTLSLPFSGSAAGTENSVFNITNTSPNHSAIAGHGGEAPAGPYVGGTGVSSYGGPSNGTSSAIGTGGSGVHAIGGQGIGIDDGGGSGVTAIGGNASGQSGWGGPGVTATGGNGVEGGDGIAAIAGTGSGGINGNGIYAMGGDGTETFAGYFQGDVEVLGTLSKSSGSFKIDDPLDPANKYLYHSFVESPDMKNIYDGNVVTDGSGTATRHHARVVRGSEHGFPLSTHHHWPARPSLDRVGNQPMAASPIKTSKPGVKVSWQVTGIRQDAWAKAHRIPVEVDKAQRDQGHYLHPELFGHEGQPSIAETHHPRPAAPAPGQ